MEGCGTVQHLRTEPKRMLGLGKIELLNGAIKTNTTSGTTPTGGNHEYSNLHDVEALKGSSEGGDSRYTEEIMFLPFEAPACLVGSSTGNSFPVRNGINEEGGQFSDAEEDNVPLNATETER